MDLEQFWAAIQSALDSLGIEMTSSELMVCLGIGAAAGWIASQVVGGKGGIFRYVIAGILGSFLGPVLLDLTGIVLPTFGMQVINDILVATVGAVAIVLAARIIG
jgi:uncharacterized membrane protein YeaQ/YmgE (transglycosylase-associated protein family)